MTFKCLNKKESYCDINYASLNYFDTLLKNSIVSKTDIDGNITFANSNFLKITGFTKEEIMGQNHNILRHPDVDSKIFEDLWRTIQSAKVWRGRLLSKNKNNSEFWAETTIIPLIDDKTDKIIEYIAIRNDITEFLYMQRKLQKQKVEKDKQKKISDAQKSFLILFTHELKTPLNAIINFSKYLLKHICNGTIDAIKLEKREKLLNEIVTSATKMLDDITGLIELSKIKSGKMNYNLSEFNIIDALNEVISEHCSLKEVHNVSLEIDFNCNKCIIKSDFYHFKQILSNVISNSYKYSNKNVKISLKCREKTCVFIVEDDGVGIKNKEKIFDLFEQEEANIFTRETKGTGVGLSFLKYLCEDLHISYKLEDSKELGGVKFTFNLLRYKEKI